MEPSPFIPYCTRLLHSYTAPKQLAQGIISIRTSKSSPSSLNQILRDGYEGLIHGIGKKNQTFGQFINKKQT
jgi:hypothetical protein